MVMQDLEMLATAEVVVAKVAAVPPRWLLLQQHYWREHHGHDHVVALTKTKMNLVSCVIDDDW